MSLVSISEAAKLAGLSRTQIYRYISKGKVSVNKDDPNHPKIDTIELLRVFPKLHPTERPDTYTTERPDTAKKELLLQRVHHLEELLQERDKRLQEKDERIGELKQALAMIGHQVTPPPARGFWSRIMRRN
jgi:DNA-binding transcriptional MerR regulator